MIAAQNTLWCSFCGKNQHEVKTLIAGPTVFICNECVALCVGMLKEQDDETARESARETARKKVQEAPEEVPQASPALLSPPMPATPLGT